MTMRCHIKLRFQDDTASDHGDMDVGFLSKPHNQPQQQPENQHNYNNEYRQPDES